MIPSHGSDAGSVNQSRDVDLVIVRSIRFLHQHRMIHREQERQIVQAVTDSHRFHRAPLPFKIPLTSVAVEKFQGGLSLIIQSGQMKKTASFCPLQPAHDDLPADLCRNFGRTLNQIGLIVLP